MSNQGYSILGSSFIRRKTDLNDRCISRILDEIKETDCVVDVAAGRGYLVRLLSENAVNDVTAVDIVFPNDMYKVDGIKYVNGSLSKLPFDDNTFDVVVCTHALEHVKNIELAVSELKRICRHKLIIVVPCQREYRYTVDLHINFFPYEFDLRKYIGNNAEVIKLDNDWYCTEILG